MMNDIESVAQTPQPGPNASHLPRGGMVDLQTSNLTDHFLIAPPEVSESVFAGTVIYVWEHTPEGALGIIINRATEINFSDLVARLQLKTDLSNLKLARTPIFFGGPVQAERGMVLHPLTDGATPARQYLSTQNILSRMGVTSSFDVLEAIVNGEGPEKFFLGLGYAGWSAGQLEKEMSQNVWLTVRADYHLIFDSIVPMRYAGALKLLGINMFQLTGETGHA